MIEQRAYQRSHPWITFDIDLQGASPQFWMLLGEARSKCDHIKYVPLRQETAQRLNLLYLSKGVNATTAIEGNTLTEEEVRERLEGQLELPLSKEYLGIEIDNMVDAYNRIIQSVEGGHAPELTVETLKQLNKEILSGLEVEDHVEPGELRQCSVAAGPYIAPPWQDVPYLLDRLCRWIASLQAPHEQQRLPYAFIKAVLAHVYIELIHPFGDGNGRLGRLVEFLVLISHGVPQPAAHVLTSHYNDTRTEYYRQLNEASRNGGDLRDFLHYAAQGFVDGLVSAIKQLHAQQEGLMWAAVVDEAFTHRHTPAANRQRLLAIELGRGRRPVPKARLRRLTPALAEAYAGKTAKTVSRDVNRLKELGFVRTEQRGRLVIAALERVQGMRPFAAEAE